MEKRARARSSRQPASRLAERKDAVAEQHEDQGLSLIEYAGVVWRQKWIVLAFTLAGLGAMLAWSYTRAPVYEASAAMVYQQRIDLSDPLGGSSSNTALQQRMDLEMQNVVNTIGSPEMRQRAQSALGSAADKTWYSISASIPPSETYSGQNTVVDVNAKSGEPEVAADVANAFANAYNEWRGELDQEAIQAGIDAVQNELAKYTTVLERQSSDYVILQQRLRDLQILQATSTGPFRVTNPATAPGAPSSPDPMRDAIVGLAAGLILGVIVAFVRQQLDKKVHSDEELSQLLGLPVLGRLPRFPKKTTGSDLVVALKDPHSLEAEAFRVLRSNLDFVTLDDDVKAIMVTSSVRGEGKSVAISNLAVSLASAGKRVVLIDCDLRRPRIHSYFNLNNATGVSTVVTARTPLEDTVQSISLSSLPRVLISSEMTVGGRSDTPVALPEETGWLRVLTSGPLPPNPGEIAASKRLGDLIARLKDGADLVLVDSPALLAVGDTNAIARLVDGLVFLTDLDAVDRPMIEEARERLSHMPCRRLGLVLQRQKNGKPYRYVEYYADGTPRDARGNGSGNPSARGALAGSRSRH